MASGSPAHKPLSDYSAGDCVWAKFGRRGEWWPAKVQKFDEADGKLTVVYFDDEEENSDGYEFDSKTAGKVKPWTDPNVIKFAKQSKDMGEMRKRFDDALFAARKAFSAPAPDVDADADADSDDDLSPTVSQMPVADKFTLARRLSAADEYQDSSDEDEPMQAAVDSDSDSDSDDELPVSQPVSQDATYREGQVVWLKIPNYASWPSRVIKVTESGKAGKKKKAYRCQLFEWRPNGAEEEQYTVKPDKVKLLSKYSPDGVAFERLFELAKKDKALLKMKNGLELLEKAVAAAAKFLYQGAPEADASEESGEEEADHVLPSATKNETVGEPVDENVQTTTTTETIVVKEQLISRKEETTEYKREAFSDGRTSKRPAGVLSPTHPADRDPAEVTPDRSAKKVRTETDYYSEQDILKALKGKPFKGKDKIKKLLETLMSKKNSKRAKNWAKADKNKADRDKFKEQARALGGGKIPPSRIQNEWDDQFEEHLDTLLGINGQGDFYWSVVVPEAVIYVHSALEGITLANAEKMVERMSQN